MNPGIHEHRSYADRRVRVAVNLPPQHADWADIRRAVVAAEAAGADLVTTWDHFYPLGGDPDGKHFECWTMLAAFAEVTERAEIGALVTCNSYRNPDLLADMVRTVDHISGGRLVLGIGSGWKRKDYDEYRYEFGTAGSRLDDLAAALPRIERRLSRLNPPPTRHVPVLIGGSGERKTLRLVARHADIWHSFADASEFARKSAVLDGWCGKEGRDPAAIERSVGLPTGRAEQQAQGLYDLGARLFTLSAHGPAYDLGEHHELLEWRDAVNSRR